MDISARSNSHVKIEMKVNRTGDQRRIGELRASVCARACAISSFRSLTDTVTNDSLSVPDESRVI